MSIHSPSNQGISADRLSPIRAVFFLTIALVAHLVFAGPAAAAQRALVIGNDAYFEVEALKRAVSDAWTVGDALEANGYEVTRQANLRRRDFSVVLNEFVKTLQEGDEAAFFFAGHGVAIGGENFLLPTDIPNQGPEGETLIKSEAFSLSDVLGAMRSRKVRLSLLIIDACRNNPFKQDGRRTLGASRGLRPVQAPEGTFIMFSAGVDQQALDSLGPDDEHKNSVFVRKLVPLITTPGLALPQVARQVRREVNALSAQISHKQTPAYYDEVLGDVYLAGPGKPNASQKLAALPKQEVVPAKPAEPVRNIFRTVPWDRTIEVAELTSIAVGKDQSTYVSGLIYGNRNGYLDFHGGLVKLGPTGSQVWRKVFDYEGDNGVYDIEVLDNTELMIAGWSTPKGHNYRQMWMARLTAAGEVMSTNTFGSRQTADAAFQIVRLENGTYALAGYIRNQTSLTTAGLVIGVDKDGQEVWRQTFVESKDTYVYTATALPGGGLVVAGEHGNPPNAAWAARVSDTGRVLWKQTYSQAIGLRGLHHLSSGHLAYVGSATSKKDGSSDLWVAKAALNGNIVHELTAGADGAEIGRAVTETEGGLVAAGTTSSKGAGSSDIWLLELETWNRLAIRSDKTYGGAREENVQSIAALPDGGLLVGGQKGSGPAWVFAVSPRAEVRSAVLSGNYEGDCLRGTQWTAYKKDGSDHRIYVGLNYCEAEEAEPFLQFTCGPGEKAFSVRASVNVRSSLQGKKFPITISVDGKNHRFTGTAGHNEMAGVNELEFQVPYSSPVIESLAAGNRAAIRGGRKVTKIHLRGSRKALERLRACSDQVVLVTKSTGQ